MANGETNFNGINADDGRYLFPSLTPHDIVAMITGQGERKRSDVQESFYAAQLSQRVERATMRCLGPIAGVDATDLAQAGWGIIFSAADSNAAQIRDALKELLDYRRGQATSGNRDRYREFIGPDGHRPDETAPCPEGEFTPGITAREFCDAEVLRSIKRRSLAALRRELAARYPEYLPKGGGR